MEFAFAVPILITLLVGIVQLGILFFANAGLRQAVETGARYSTIYPSPSDSDIRTAVLNASFGLNSSAITGPVIARGTSNGVAYVDLSMSYTVSLNFGLFTTPPVTLSYSRRAYHP